MTHLLPRRESTGAAGKPVHKHQVLCTEHHVLHKAPSNSKNNNWESLFVSQELHFPEILHNHYGDKTNKITSLAWAGVPTAYTVSFLSEEVSPQLFVVLEGEKVN